MNPLPPVGSRVRMVVPNSNWGVGEVGTITAVHPAAAGKFPTPERVSVKFDGRTDDYVAFGHEIELVR